VLECDLDYVYDSDFLGVKSSAYAVCIVSRGQIIWAVEHTDERLADCRRGCRLHELCPHGSMCPDDGAKPWTCRKQRACPDVKADDEKVQIVEPHSPAGSRLLKISCPIGTFIRKATL